MTAKIFSNTIMFVGISAIKWWYYEYEVWSSENIN